LSRDVLDEGGRDLGFLRNGAFVFGREDESNILIDYCIYNVLRRGRNAIQSILAQFPPPEGSDEALVLAASTRPWFSVFGVERTDPGIGVMVQDIFRQSRHRLIDIGFSRSACPGVLLATRVIPFEGFIMTTGAPLPLSGGASKRDRLTQQVTKAIFDNDIRSFEKLTPHQDRALARAIISTALSWGASSQVQYQDAGPQAHRPSQSHARQTQVPAKRKKRHKRR
jgi:hypothetical protein